MPDFAPNFTARYKVRYQVLTKTHSITWRLARGASDGMAAAALMEDFWAALSGAMYNDFTVLSAAFAPEDSDVFLPTIAPASPTGAISSPGGGAGAVPLALSFPGRADDGQRAIFYQYGLTLVPVAGTSVLGNFRVNPGEVSQIDDAIALLVAADPLLVSNSNSPVNWYPYANVKDNDHWVRKQRS